MKITLSVIKADIGGYVGHTESHPDVIKVANECMAGAKGDGVLIDYHVAKCGDDLGLIMTHQAGENSEKIHKLAWDTFVICAEVARKLKLHGAGQDLVSDTFSGTVRGLGPGVAEMEFEERTAETVLILMADKASAGTWNMPLYKMFADPFNTVGLVIADNMHQGFAFDVQDTKEQRQITFNAPEEIYDLLVFIGAPRFLVSAVHHRGSGEIAAVSSTQRFTLVSEHYLGKEDPVCIVRSQGQFPAVGEVLEPFVLPFLVAGWMRGSHHGPLMPVSFKDSTPTRFNGPPRVIAAGFQLAEGRLVGPRDMFADKSFDHTRQRASDIADFMRGHGPFEPHRLHLDEMRDTTMSQVMRKLERRFVSLE